MDNNTIAELRQQFQQIRHSKASSPQELVGYMGAMQAQDYPMAKWGIALRLPNAADANIEAALNAGDLVRTHILRPTWHIVAGVDVRWMLALSKKQIKSALATYDRQMGLDANLLSHSKDLIIKCLEGNNHLTRAEIMAYFEANGIKTNPGRAAHFMFNAEIEALVCNGVMRGKEQTYALLDEKVPQKGLVLNREEAIVELAKRYFTSHAPATLQDFYWWSGLPMPDARAGLEAFKKDLDSFVWEEKTYFLPQNSPQNIQSESSMLFLPSFDEYCVSYKNRDAVFSSQFQGLGITGNGIFKPIIVRSGQVIGIWKRSIAKNQVVIETTFFDEKQSLQNHEIEEKIQRFGKFLGLPVVLKN